MGNKCQATALPVSFSVIFGGGKGGGSGGSIFSETGPHELTSQWADPSPLLWLETAHRISDSGFYRTTPRLPHHAKLSAVCRMIAGFDSDDYRMIHPNPSGARNRMWHLKL